MKTWIRCSEKEYKWRKPILRVGSFEKTAEGKVFTFSQEHINYFAEAFSTRIPVPLEHTQEPEENRGWCVGMEVEEDILYGIFELSETHVPDPNIYDVSVNIPCIQGRIQPIDHVALTSYPVVKGLGSFEAISCSLVSRKEEKTVDWKTLGAALGLSNLTEDNASEMLTKHYIDLSTKVETLEKEKETLEVSLSERPALDVKDIQKKHAGVLKLAKNGRKATIGSLPLSKAARDKLEEIFCDEDSIALSTLDDRFDNFEQIMEAIGEHDGLELGEVTGAQLSDRNKEKESGLIRDAKARAKAAKERSNA